MAAMVTDHVVLMIHAHAITVLARMVKMDTLHGLTLIARVEHAQCKCITTYILIYMLL